MEQKPMESSGKKYSWEKEDCEITHTRDSLEAGKALGAFSGGLSHKFLDYTHPLGTHYLQAVMEIPSQIRTQPWTPHRASYALQRVSECRKVQAHLRQAGEQLGPPHAGHTHASARSHPSSGFSPPSQSGSNGVVETHNNEKDLCKHQRNIHSNDKPFLCNECGLTLNKPLSLLRRQRTHLGALPVPSLKPQVLRGYSHGGAPARALRKFTS
ncbi:Zinc finger protein 648 [Fukomys damarensis]|uniref:Zinc finger protein 648 n=1 Tax=Fukomys damarensis TaxID=885580 RepID=A0A091DI24_FUKDA|nr:Zinc finger protein 648 [Fukomys damarensis]